MLLILAFGSQGRRITMSSGSSYAMYRHPDPKQNKKETEKNEVAQLSSEVEGIFSKSPQEHLIWSSFSMLATEVDMKMVLLATYALPCDAANFPLYSCFICEAFLVYLLKSFGHLKSPLSFTWMKK